MSCGPAAEGGGRQFFGKYRGKVVDNIDPLELHRLLVDVPALGGMELSWALPCVPYAGMQVGLCLLPPIGANVWVEFEGGDPTHPIWTGCFWAELEKPILALTPLQKVLKTESLTLVADDTPGEGGIKMIVSPPAVGVPVTILIDSAGIQIETGAAMISISPEEMTGTIAPTVATLTEASIALATEGAVTVTAATTEVTSEVTVNGATVVNGETTINGAVAINGATNMLGDLDVEGEVSALGDVAIVGDASVLGAFEVVGDVAIVGAAEVAGDVAAAAVEVAIP